MFCVFLPPSLQCPSIKTATGRDGEAVEHQKWGQEKWAPCCSHDLGQGQLYMLSNCVQGTQVRFVDFMLTLEK